MSWFTAPSGATVVAAYDAIGASSLADSYVNEANPGTYDAAPGVAPTWAYGTGWTFNGTTQYLTTGVVPAVNQTWSVLVRYSGAAQSGSFQTILGSYRDSSGLGALLVQAPRIADGAHVRVFNGSIIGTAWAANSPFLAAGVYGMAGRQPYRDGVAESTLVPISTGSGSAVPGMFIGGLAYNAGTLIQPAGVAIQAVAIYSSVLTADDVTAITAAMNALPSAASSAVASIVQAHGLYLGATAGGA